MTTTWPVYLACLTYLATLSLGASVQYGQLKLGRWRMAHHLLYFATWVTVLGAVAWGVWQQTAWWWLPLGSLPILSLFPRQRATTRAHRVLALAGLLVWGAILGGLRLLGQD